MGNIIVIDTETNYNNQVISVGIAVADKYFKLIDKQYYIVEGVSKYSLFLNALTIVDKNERIKTSRENIIADIKKKIEQYEVTDFFAYNANFDYTHLPELKEFNWYDIMKVVPYRQYNTMLPPTAEFCKTGRLKKDYSAEKMYQLLANKKSYTETHNALYDAIDELKIMELLGQPIELYYSIAKI